MCLKTVSGVVAEQKRPNYFQNDVKIQTVKHVFRISVKKTSANRTVLDSLTKRLSDPVLFLMNL